MNSVDNTFQNLWKNIEYLKGKSHRPCYVSVGVDKLEYVHGKDNILKYVVPQFPG
jgi:hypothetical protein